SRKSSCREELRLTKDFLYQRGRPALRGTPHPSKKSLAPAVLRHAGDRRQNFDADKFFYVLDAAQPSLQILQGKGETDTGHQTAEERRQCDDVSARAAGQPRRNGFRY